MVVACFYFCCLGGNVLLFCCFGCLGGCVCVCVFVFAVWAGGGGGGGGVFLFVAVWAAGGSSLTYRPACLGFKGPNNKKDQTAKKTRVPPKPV